MYKRITQCRICGNKNLVSLLNLGEQALTGIFPKSAEENITSGPLELVKCHPHNPDDMVCHLVQLNHSYESEEMYGLNYGYRSGLNQSMVRHLRDIVAYATSLAKPAEGDLIIDIGSNDSTLLQGYPTDKKLRFYGIDPTGKKFAKYYPDYIHLVPDFFSAEAVKKIDTDKKAKIITSIAMFYDLEDPTLFVKEIMNSLADDGIWIFEQSYLPLMISTNAYDTVCHEHVEYYALEQIKWIMDSVGFKIIDVELNDINGGSFRVTVAKEQSNYTVSDSVRNITDKENQLNLKSLKPYDEFNQNIIKHRNELRELIDKLTASGKKVFGYGASTKGNVILQYCGFTTKEIPYIAEVNEDKFGHCTPYTHIPIISEKDAREMKPDYYLVLPWHFRKGILEKESEFRKNGGKFIFPLPSIEIV
jgi:hypothetical protein